ncbi:flavodoxin family protein [Kocuria himachalensis]
MTVVVVYESMYGNTHLIAEAVGAGLGEAGMAVDVVPVEAAMGRGLEPGDVLVVGAPTHVHGLSRTSTREAAVHDAPAHDLELDPAATGPGVRQWLDSLGSTGARAAAFDTRVKAPAVLTGRASQRIAKVLQHHGFQMLTPPESFLVTTDNQLLPGEEARARQWATTLAALL